jgi:hypothetical protein
VRAIDFDDPVPRSNRKVTPPSEPPIAPPTDQDVASLLEILRKKLSYQKVDLYADPVYARSTEVELFIVEDWQRAKAVQR